MKGYFYPQLPQQPRLDHDFVLTDYPHNLTNPPQSSRRSLVGTIGAGERMEGTVIGDTVNLAARLEELTKLYLAPLIVSEATINSAKLEAGQDLLQSTRILDVTKVKGKSEDIKIHEVFAWESKEIIATKLEYKGKFSECIFKLTTEDKREKVLLQLKKLVETYPLDVTAKRILAINTDLDPH